MFTIIALFKILVNKGVIEPIFTWFTRKGGERSKAITVIPSGLQGSAEPKQQFHQCSSLYIRGL
jgi:hypothetical protein